MPIYIPRNNVRNWYQYDISASIELIESFVEGVEIQAAESVTRYERQKEVSLPEGVPDDANVSPEEHHQGLDGATWDLRGIFYEYFPSLQRRSALLSVCGYFEHELDKLCLLVQAEGSFRVALSDLKGRGIERSTAYLEKVAGLNVHKNSPDWNQIANIQKIRNVIVHQDGKLHDHGGTPNRAAIDYVSQIDTLGGDDEVLVARGFLKHVVDTYKRYFALLGESISSEQETNQLATGGPT